MPEHMPDNQKVPAGSRFAAKAAAVALAVSGALLLALFFAAALPKKTQDWRTALPGPTMAGKDAEVAFLRAKYLHEAAVRPRLIQAGFFSPADAETGRTRSAYGNPGISETLTRVLWTMRTFPELHDAFLAMLLDEKTGRPERTDNFFKYAGFMASVAESLAEGRAGQGYNPRYEFHPDNRGALFDLEDLWFAYFANGPRSNSLSGRAGHSRDDDGKTAVAVYEAKLALANELLPRILQGAVAEMDRRAVLAAGEKGEDGKDPDSRNRETRYSLEGSLYDLSLDVKEALAEIWKNHETPGFLAQVREVLALKDAPLGERYSAVPLVARKPGLPPSEYVFWQRYKRDLASVTSCIGTAPASYAYLLGCMDELMAATTGTLKANGTIILDGQQGPGVSMARTQNFAPGKNLRGNLYLLADMALALKDAPAYDLSRAFPIFRGMLYRHLENQPLVLPLNLKNPADKALLDWYDKTGWATGRMVLFSAVGSPADVARHWGVTHFAWWDNGAQKTEPDLAFMHPVSGHFMAGFLPELRGKAASRFLGPVTGLWFGKWNVDADGWVAEKYEARPEVMPSAPAPARGTPLRSPILDWLSGEKAATPAPAHSDAAATMLIDGGLRAALTAAYMRNYQINLVTHLAKTPNSESVAPRDVAAFVDTAIPMLFEWGFSRDPELRPAMEYLWRFRNEPETEKRVKAVLSDTSLRPRERLDNVRKTLSLPEKESF